jgi:hypothetical protein
MFRIISIDEKKNLKNLALKQVNKNTPSTIQYIKAALGISNKFVSKKTSIKNSKIVKKLPTKNK